MIGKQVIILELTTAHLKLIGQLVHIHLTANADDENIVGKDLLYELLLQTENVHKEPEKHFVYPPESTKPFDVVLSNPVWYKPIEGSCVSS